MTTLLPRHRCCRWCILQSQRPEISRAWDDTDCANQYDQRHSTCVPPRGSWSGWQGPAGSRRGPRCTLQTVGARFFFRIGSRECAPDPRSIPKKLFLDPDLGPWILDLGSVGSGIPSLTTHLRPLVLVSCMYYRIYLYMYM